MLYFDKNVDKVIKKPWKKFWISLLIFIITLVLFVLTGPINDNLALIFFFACFAYFIKTLYDLILGLISKKVARMVLKTSEGRALKEEFKKETVKYIEKFKIYVGSQMMICAFDWPLKYVCLKEIKALDYLKHDDEMYTLFIIMNSGDSHYLTFKEKEFLTTYNMLFDLLSSITPVLNLKPHVLSSDSKFAIYKVKEHYKDRYQIKDVEPGDFFDDYSEGSIALYYSQNGKRYALIIADVCGVIKAAENDDGQWEGIGLYGNDSGSEGLIKVIDRELSKKETYEEEIHYSKFAGILFGIFTVFFLLIGYGAYMQDKDIAGAVLGLFMLLFVIASLYFTLYFLLTKITLKDNKITFRNFLGRKKTFDVEAIDEIRNNPMSGEYGFYSKGKKLFGITQAQSEKVYRFVHCVNLSRTGSQLNLPENKK